MAYTCLDDHWDEHPKYAMLDFGHMGLMACATVYCNRLLTDGFVPDRYVRARAGNRLASKLVEVGVWTREESGYRIVGYLDHNASRAEVLAKREAARVSGRNGGLAKSKALPRVP